MTHTADTADTAGTADPSGEPLLRVRDLTKTFPVRSGGRTRQLRALGGISFDLRRGETLGLVGESGCGKSTLARTLLMLERPDSGTVRFDGVDPFTLRGARLLQWRRRVQMVFQDPFASLNARMTAGDIVSEPWRTHKDLFPSAKERGARVRELLGLVGLRAGDEHRYPQEFSGGQRQRIGIARALALDLSVQAQVLNLLNDLQRQLGVSYVFISHDLSVVRHVADRVMVMYLGGIVEQGGTEAVFGRALHPYSAALMSAAPSLDEAGRGRQIILEGELPSPLSPPSGCRFRTRCWKATDECAAASPEPAPDPEDGGHTAACFHPMGKEAEPVPAGRGAR